MLLYKNNSVTSKTNWFPMDLNFKVKILSDFFYMY